MAKKEKTAKEKKERVEGVRRGSYSDITAVAKKEKGTDVWEIESIPKPKELLEIDRQRHEINKQIDKIRSVLIKLSEQQFLPKHRYESSEKKERIETNVKRWINQNIYGTKLKGVEVRPIKDTEIDISRLLKEASVLRENVDKLSKKKRLSKKEKKRLELYRKSLKQDEDTLQYLLTREEYTAYKKRNYDAIKIEHKAVKVSDLLKKGRELYKERKPLDSKSKQMRQKYSDRSFKHVYDVLRIARKNRQAYVYINNKPVLASQITYTFDYDEDGKRINKRYILPSNAISGWNLGGITKFDISVSKKEVELKVIKEKVRQKPQAPPKEIIFEQDNFGRLYTKTNLKKLFDQAEKTTGQRVLFINNQAVVESDFEQIDKYWYLQPFSISLEPGVADLSFTYNEEYFTTAFKKIIKREENKQRPILAEFDSTVNILGREHTLHIIIYGLNALIALKETQRLTKKTGGKFFWVATQYRITDSLTKTQMDELAELKKKPELLLNEEERRRLAELSELSKISIVAEVEDAIVISENELPQYQNTHDTYLVLSFVKEKQKNVWVFAVVLKTNAIETEVAGYAVFINNSP